MKKKLLSIIAVSAALATAGSVLVACGGDDGNVGAKTDVTKEQWAAALSINSFASNLKADVTMVNEKEKMSQALVLLVGSQKYGDYSLTRTNLSLEGVKQDERTRIRIVEAEREAHYTLYSGLADEEGEDGEWEVGEWRVEYEDPKTYDDDQWYSCIDDMGVEYIFALADKYDSFEYKNGAYVLKGQDGIVIEDDAGSFDEYTSYTYTSTATKITVKFADAKLAFIELTINNHYETTYNGETEDTNDTETMDETYKATFMMSYGAQTINAPEGAVEWTPPGLD